MARKVARRTKTHSIKTFSEKIFAYGKNIEKSKDGLICIYIYKTKEIHKYSFLIWQMKRMKKVIVCHLCEMERLKVNISFYHILERTLPYSLCRIEIGSVTYVLKYFINLFRIWRYYIVLSFKHIHILSFAQCFECAVL